MNPTLPTLSCCFFLVLVTTASRAADAPRPVASKIERVTVFLKGAQVTRVASLTLPAGTSSWVFTDLAARVSAPSVRVTGEGNFTVVAVNYQLNFLRNPGKTDETTRLESQQKALVRQSEAEQSALAVLMQETQMLEANRALAGQQTGIRVAELRAASDFFRERLTDISRRQLEATRNLAQVKLELERISQQLVGLRATVPPPTGEIVVTLAANAPVPARLTVSYLAENAQWLPSYDLRVKDVASPIALLYKASVSQQTGEDWTNVRLTISSGDPAQNGTRPTLLPWQLGYGRATSQGTPTGNVRGRVTDEVGEPLPGVSVVVKGTTVGTATDAQGNYDLALPANATTLQISYIGFATMEVAVAAVVNVALQPDVRALSEVVVTGYGSDNVGDNDQRSRRAAKAAPSASIPLVVTQQVATTTVTFEIERPYTIPTDGKPYTVEMQASEVPATYEYFCAPKLDTDAFLTAQITNWDTYQLLDGEANLYFEGTYLGKSVIDTRNTEDTLELSLGRDKNIVVKRTKVKDKNARQLLGGQQTDARNWEIDVRSKKSVPVRLTLEDQLPLSTSKEIEVTRAEHNGAQLDPDTGKLTWRLTLLPAQTQKLSFRYTVRYPKDKKLWLD